MDLLDLFGGVKDLRESFPRASGELVEVLAERMYKNIMRSFGRWPTREFSYPVWLQPLAKDTQKDRASSGYTRNRPLLRNGFLRDTIEKTVNASAGYAIIGSPQKYALYQELGTISGGPGNKRGKIDGHYYIPPRPIFGKAVLEAQQWLQQNGESVFGNFLQL
jgi:phage gpG-like protein